MTLGRSRRILPEKVRRYPYNRLYVRDGRTLTVLDGPKEDGLVRRVHLRGADVDLCVGFGWMGLYPTERRNWVEYDDLVANLGSRGKGAKKKIEGERILLRTDVLLLPSGPV
jgi:hypothetical protein